LTRCAGNLVGKKCRQGSGHAGLGTRLEATPEDVCEAEARLGELDVELRRALQDSVRDS